MKPIFKKSTAQLNLGSSACIDMSPSDSVDSFKPIKSARPADSVSSFNPPASANLLSSNLTASEFNWDNSAQTPLLVKQPNSIPEEQTDIQDLDGVTSSHSTFQTTLLLNSFNGPPSLGVCGHHAPFVMPTGSDFIQPPSIYTEPKSDFQYDTGDFGPLANYNSKDFPCSTGIDDSIHGAVFVPQINYVRPSSDMKYEIQQADSGDRWDPSYSYNAVSANESLSYKNGVPKKVAVRPETFGSLDALIQKPMKPLEIKIPVEEEKKEEKEKPKVSRLRRLLGKFKKLFHYSKKPIDPIAWPTVSTIIFSTTIDTTISEDTTELSSIATDTLLRTEQVLQQLFEPLEVSDTTSSSLSVFTDKEDTTEVSTVEISPKKSNFMTIQEPSPRTTNEYKFDGDCPSALRAWLCQKAKQKTFWEEMERIGASQYFIPV